MYMVAHVTTYRYYILLYIPISTWRSCLCLCLCFSGSANCSVLYSYLSIYLLSWVGNVGRHVGICRTAMQMRIFIYFIYIFVQRPTL